MKGGSPGSRLLDWNAAEADSKIKKLTFLKKCCCGCALKRKYLLLLLQGCLQVRKPLQTLWMRANCNPLSRLSPNNMQVGWKIRFVGKTKKKVEERQQLKSPCEVNLFTLQGLVKVSPNPLRPHGEPYLTYPSDPGTLGGSK